MHELAIAQAIAEGVSEHAAACQATRVTGVRLRIGEAAGIMPEALRSSFELVASDDPVLAGAQLSIDIVPHRARCRRCGGEFAVVNFIAQCPACAVWDTDVLSGTELELREMEFESRREPE